MFRLPEALATRQLVTDPQLCNQETCPSPAGVFGEAVTHCLWLHSGKTRVPCRSFLSPLFNVIQVWHFPQTGKRLPFQSMPDTNSPLNLSTSVTLARDLRLWIFYNFHIVPLFFPLYFISLHQESRKSFQLVVKDD